MVVTDKKKKYKSVSGFRKTEKHSVGERGFPRKDIKN
jgi:hypothetical protein